MLLVLIPRGRRALTTARMISGARKASGMVLITWRLVQLSMGGPRYIWWNFVSSRPERIDQAKEEWACGRFDTVPGDEKEFIPLPETQDRPRRATGGVLYRPSTSA